MKICKICKIEKESVDFAKYKYKNVYNDRKICKFCYLTNKREYETKYRNSNREKINKIAKKSRKNNLESRRIYNRNYMRLRGASIRLKYKKWLDNIKISIGCVCCKYKLFANSLHFHHLDKKFKSFGIAKAATQQRSKSKILDEIKKCVILCANCHSEIEGGFKTLEIKVYNYPEELLKFPFDN